MELSISCLNPQWVNKENFLLLCCTISGDRSSPIFNLLTALLRIFNIGLIYKLHHDYNEVYLQILVTVGDDYAMNSFDYDIAN
jgi:hypothetical protein